ncbi:MAG: prolipoprotein diacylglyceryl transferase [Candidatus Hydrogenedentota bacterium]|nr:MAG: prolipoprotein diacylglyceryl transferase [Candidatus Hydrogenedentota bacterium]
MHPILFEFGFLKFNSYGLMIAVGFLTALYFIQRDAKAAGLDPKKFADMAFVVLPLGIVGTRLAHIAMFPDLYSWSDPIGWIAVWRGGLVFQGGPPLALIYVYYFLKKHNIPFLKSADLIFPYLPLAHGFGRIGCFLKGCCYGAPTSVNWAVNFPKQVNESEGFITGSPPYIDHLNRFADVTLSSTHSLGIHPTQLYSFVGLITICATILLLRKHWHPFTGFTMPAYLVLYGIFRFVVEFYRGDHNPVHIWGFSDQQLFSLFFAVLGVILFFILRHQSRKSPETS